MQIRVCLAKMQSHAFTHRDRDRAGRTRLVQRIRARAQSWRLLASDFDSLTKVVAEPDFSAGLQLVRHARFLLDQDIIAAGPAHAALHR